MATSQGHQEPHHVLTMSVALEDTCLELSEARRGQSVPQECAPRLVRLGIAEGEAWVSANLRDSGGRKRGLRVRLQMQPGSTTQKLQVPHKSRPLERDVTGREEAGANCNLGTVRVKLKSIHDGLFSFLSFFLPWTQGLRACLQLCSQGQQ